jgi:adenosylhomocysteine nucleosidase
MGIADSSEVQHCATASGEPERQVRSLLLVGAERREFTGLLRLCPKTANLGWPIAWSRWCDWNGRRVLMTANGAGASLAARALDVAMSEAGADAVVSVGFCGALDEDLVASDIFVASSIRGAGRCYSAHVPRSSRKYVSGVLTSTNHVAGTVEEKRRLRATGASAVDMEAAGVAERAEAWRLPLYCVRAVTDTAKESFALDLNAALRSDGHFDTMHLMRAAIRRPTVLMPELIRLHSRCRTAARALGEFLANCRF